MSFLVLGNLTCAVLLAISAVAKLKAPDETRDAFRALRLPAWLRRTPAPAVLPWAELALAALLILGAGWVLVVAAVASVLLFAAYAVVIARALGFDEPVNCHCFGALGGGDVSRRTLLRNILLLLTALFGLVGAMSGVSIYSQPAAGWAWVALAALAATVAVLSLGGGGEAVRGEAPSASPSMVVWDVVTGQPTALRTLAGRHGGVVLLSLISGCGGCERVIAALPGWLAEEPRRTVVPMRPAGRDLDDPKWHELDLLHEDWGSNVAHALMGSRRPSAIELDAKGVPVGPPAVGVLAVETLIRGRSDREPAVEPPTEEPDDGLADYVRYPIPDAVLVAPDGVPQTLRELASKVARLLVVIDSLSDPALDALGRVGDWQSRLPVLRVTPVTSMRVAHTDLPEDLRMPLHYDHGGVASRALNATGQVAAVLLGADGLLAGGPVRGLDAIEEFVADIEAQIGPSE